MDMRELKGGERVSQKGGVHILLFGILAADSDRPEREPPQYVGSWLCEHIRYRHYLRRERWWGEFCWGLCGYGGWRGCRDG